MIYVIDNFFDDPHKIRSLSLNLKYSSDPDGRWPGFRSKTPWEISSLVKNKIQEKINLKCNIHSSDFQFVTGDYISGICHSDYPRKYSSICYLNENPPKNSGTEIYLNKNQYNHINDKLMKLDKHSFNKIKYYQSNKNFFLKVLYKSYLKKINKNFNNPITISNKFNRIVLFDSNLVHRAQNFFGSNLENSRLTLVTFFE